MSGSQQSSDLPKGIWKIAILLALSPAMSLLEVTMMNIALTDIGAAFGQPLSLVQWVTTAYLFAMAMVLPISAWLTDGIGGGRLHRMATLCFVSMSIASSLAPSVEVLIVCRALQGAAAGLLVPLSQLLIARAAGPHMAKVVGYTAAPVYLAPLAGPVLGAYLVEIFEWRAVFLLNVPIGCLTFVLSVLFLQKDEHAREWRKFDVLGFLQISLGLGMLLLALSNVAHDAGSGALNLTLISVALATLSWFLIRARAHPHSALLDLTLFKLPSFRTSALLLFLANAAVMGIQFLMPLYFILVVKLDISEAGLMLAPMGLGGMLAVPLIGKAINVLGARGLVCLGSGVAGLSIVSLALVTQDQSEWTNFATAAAMFLIGAGLGVISIPSFSSAYTSVPQSRMTAAMPSLNIVQRLGGPVATSLVAVVLSRVIPVDRTADLIALFAMASAPVFLITLVAIFWGEKGKA